ncbi:MAG: hypothetical protein AABN33_02660 [Acidobacteriota bacterium]
MIIALVRSIPSGFSRWSFSFDLIIALVRWIPSGFSRWSFSFDLMIIGLNSLDTIGL